MTDSYLRREWMETKDLDAEKRVLTKTILVPQVLEERRISTHCRVSTSSQINLNVG